MSYTNCPDAAAKTKADSGPIDMVLVPRAVDLGEMTVRRALPSSERQMVGPFIFVDQFGPAQLDLGAGMDVRPHPHINLATVTWLFEGAIDHRDSLGTFSTIRPGQVNLMTAGRGIVHSERSPDAERRGGPKLYGMQTWLALPDGREEIDPAFEAITELPVIEDMVTRMKEAAQAICADMGCEVEFEKAGGFDPVEFDPGCVKAVRDAAERLGYSHRDLVSGAGHDACWINRVAPTAMVMCPCVDGLSHNEAEEISKDWATAGADVLMHAVVETAGIVD